MKLSPRVGGTRLAIGRIPDGAPGQFELAAMAGVATSRLTRTTWSAPKYPATPPPAPGVALGPETGSLPRRAFCRAPSGLSFRRMGNQVEIPAVPVAKRVVASASELRPGECAGASLSANEDGPGRQAAFGVAMTGPMRLPA